jgi:hypothetical protein
VLRQVVSTSDGRHKPTLQNKISKLIAGRRRFCHFKINDKRAAQDVREVEKRLGHAIPAALWPLVTLATPSHICIVHLSHN